ncbi:MAG: AAA family ATPase [Clostridiales bacterium]|jgi:predicted kinase|nr:AAA family ATPase [Clostridiales bacterium]
MELVLFIGIQATGKSEFYKQNFFKTHIRVNLDMLKTRNREDILLEACLKAKQPLVIDNTNPTIKSREKYINAAKEAGFDVKGYYFKSVIADALQKNKQRTGKDFVPVPAILGTHKKLELPKPSEGFDSLWYVSMDSGNGFIVEGYVDEI